MELNKIKVKLIKEDSVEYERQIKGTQDIVSYINSIEDLQNNTEETAYIVCLNTKNNIVNFAEIARGGINWCNIDIKTIFKYVLLSNANKFILVHNHPSGDTTPSKLDLEVTKKIFQASKIMDIEFLDHIIIGEDFNSIFKYIK